MPDFPEDLPWIIEYRVGKMVLTTLPRRPVNFRGSSGTTDASTVRPRIPVGTDAWRVPPSLKWLRLDRLPKHWIPFLQRERGTPMDPRPKDFWQELPDERRRNKSGNR